MIEYNQLSIGQQIKKYRNAKGLSQKELSKLVNLSASYIGELERGGKTKNSSVSIKNICKIAEVLGVSLEDLACTNLKYNKNYNDNLLINKIENEIKSLSLNKLNLIQKVFSIFINKNNI